MRILAIDPSSAKTETSTNGIILLDNAKLVEHWVVGYSVKDIRNWYETEGRFIKHDVVVIEKYEAAKSINIKYLDVHYDNGIVIQTMKEALKQEENRKKQ